jgi:hypothetical protein
MLEAGVEVGLLPEGAHMLEVRVVHVGVHAEEALEDCAHHLLEVGGKGYSVLLREQRWIIQLRYNRN